MRSRKTDIDTLVSYVFASPNFGSAHLSHELHPAVMEHTGLVEALRHHCTDVWQHHHLAVTFSAGDELDSLRPDVALCLFRVAQEALTNVVRHARAQTVAVSLAATWCRPTLDGER